MTPIPSTMKCLVINLDRSPDRLAHITAEFARIGITFERIAGTDAREHPNLVLQRWIADFCRFRRPIVVPLDPIDATD